MSESSTHRVLSAVWRMESARIIAGLARMTGDVGVAEDLAQDAFVSALETWPDSGVPDNPGAWLMTTAKRRAIDLLRRDQRLIDKHAEFGRELDDGARVDSSALDDAIDDDVGDDLLRLVFTACHPLLSSEARVALTLRLLGGLATEEIARAYLIAESTIAQRIVRAKRTLSAAKVPFEVPRADERAARLSSVLEVIYLIYNEGYSATLGDDWMRPQLCDEALRLGRILAELEAGEPEVHGLVALMEIQSSRTRSRADTAGNAILLLDQDRTKWDYVMIHRGFAALDRAAALGRSPGPYQLQGLIAACHGRARTAGETDWARIAALYDALAEITRSPVVELNRAVAVSMAFGPAAGLEIVEALGTEPSMANYPLLPAVRGDLLERLGRRHEAAAEFARSASLTRNERERAVMLKRAAASGRSGRH